MQLGGYAVDGDGDATEVPLSSLFRELPVAVMKAQVEDAAYAARRRAMA